MLVRSSQRILVEVRVVIQTDFHFIDKGAMKIRATVRIKERE